MSDIRIDRMKKQYPGYWSERILSQLGYAIEVSTIASGKYDELIEEVTAWLTAETETAQAITPAMAKEAEQRLSPLSPAAKQYKMLCAGHAHIDMNWMWGYHETVSITLDTFRTVLDLMKEFPQFKFSQSQASTYRIVEEHDPQLLEEIKARVKEGRWEVSATTWVEADKNMPCGESHARHLLYTRRYLSKLLDLPEDRFQLDYEPDTFGHQHNVPEILASAGVKYYYHCRGDQTWFLYRWVSPSGKSILVYREPTWYLGYIEPALALYVPEFCRRTGVDTILKVYGVGDHGGGPTRRDLERIQDMATWTVFPEIHFGTYREYFEYVSAFEDKFPVMEGELNFIFTGCYTTQTRIKAGNRLSENNLIEAEAFCAAAAASTGFPYPAEGLADAWQKTLFNQFHDIITGSGVIDTREFALGYYQQVLAQAASQKSRAFRALTRQAEISPNPDVSGSISEGAGVGFGVADFKLAQVSRGGGLNRTFYFFNPSPYPRREVSELVIWDWNGDINRMQFTDGNGNVLEFKMLNKGWDEYWGHHYIRVCLMVDAPALGSCPVLLSENTDKRQNKYFPNDWRVESPFEPVMENDDIKVVFDRNTFDIVSLVDKASGEDLVDGRRKAGFRYILEDQRDMTAWVVGRYMEARPAVREARLVSFDRSPLKQVLTYQAPLGRSNLKVEVTLKADSRRLEYNIECDWQEIGKRGENIPQLNYWVPLAIQAPSYLYDIPFGTVEREPQHMDLPGNSFIAAMRGVQAKPGVPTAMLISGAGHGFRGVDDSIALTLIRSSFDPDPHPELGIHRMQFAIGVIDSASPKYAYLRAAANYAHPLIAYSAKGMPLPATSFMQITQGEAAFSALKLAEDCPAGDEWIIRLYEVDGKWSPVELVFFKPVERTWLVDLHENPTDGGKVEVNGRTVKLTAEPFAITSLRVKFA